ncbi:MAG: glycosyltransferase family 2 protein [Candidatus Hydrogenedentes bacterium]|nr:glycosyltransferase family 2 protein [Candidatus Hydrogenedentota bacterium]
MHGIAIIIVTWNSEACIARCLDSVFECHPQSDLQVIVVDNGSRDATVDTIQQYAPRVRAIPLGANTGFPKACNFGASLAQCSHLLFLNPDACLVNDVPAMLVRFLEAHPDAGAAGPAIRDHHGAPAPFAARHFPRLRFHLLRHFGLRALAPHTPFFSGETFGDKGLTQPLAVPCLTGAAICIPRTLFEQVGGFPEYLPMYHDDMGLCAAITHAGRRCYYIPEAHIEHLGGESSSLSPARLQLRQLENGQAPWLFFRQERGPLFAALFTTIVFLASLFRLLLVFVLLPAALLRAPLRPRFQRVFRESLFLFLWSVSRKSRFARRFDTCFDPLPPDSVLQRFRQAPP